MSQGSLKQLEPLFENAVIFDDSTEVRLVLQKSFIMFHLDLFYWLTFISTFQTALQNLELFLFFALWLSMTYLTSLQFCLCLFICTPHQSSHCTVFFFFFTLLSWLLVRRCHPLIVFRHLPESSSSIIIHSVSLCEKWSRAAARVVAKADVTDCWCSNDCFQFTEECPPLQKMLVLELKCS